MVQLTRWILFRGDLSSTERICRIIVADATINYSIDKTPLFIGISRQ